MNPGLEQLYEYKAMVTRLFPALPQNIIDDWSITDNDALALTCLLNRYPREVIVLEIGTFVGVSAFHLASQPKVSKVISVDMNLPLSELGRRSGWGGDLSSEVRTLDVAEATLACFAEQQRKVELVAGTAGNVGQEVSAHDAPLVAFVDGDHSKQSVEGDLRSIFEKYTHAVAVLHDCGSIKRAPDVLAGVAAFVKTSSREYRFRPLKKLGTYLRPPNLGILYPREVADNVERLAAELMTVGPIDDPSSTLFRVSQLLSLLWKRAYYRLRFHLR